jgi:hypothetical protein
VSITLGNFFAKLLEHDRLPRFRRERDWSLSHRRLGRAAAGDYSASHDRAQGCVGKQTDRALFLPYHQDHAGPSAVPFNESRWDGPAKRGNGDWRKIIDTVSFILGLLALACVRNGLETDWFTAIAAGLLVYLSRAFCFPLFAEAAAGAHVTQARVLLGHQLNRAFAQPERIAAASHKQWSTG